MSFLLASASSQHLLVSSAPVTTYPFTLACWFKTSSTSAQILMSLGVANQSSFHRIFINTSGTFQVFGDSFNTAYGVSAAGSGSPITVNTWAHAAVVYSSETSRLAYKDGIAGVENTASVPAPGVNSLMIGGNYDPSPTAFFNGDIAECCVYNAALTAGEVLALARRHRPHSVRPQNLARYDRLIRDLQSLRGGANLTNVNGATVSPHPAIIYP